MVTTMAVNLRAPWLTAWKRAHLSAHTVSPYLCIAERRMKEIGQYPWFVRAETDLETPMYLMHSSMRKQLDYLRAVFHIRSSVYGAILSQKSSTNTKLGVWCITSIAYMTPWGGLRRPKRKGRRRGRKRLVKVSGTMRTGLESRRNLRS